MARKHRRANQNWFDDPAKLQRIKQVWELYLRRTPLEKIASDMGVSIPTISRDITRARALLRGAITQDIGQITGEALEERHRISAELWETLASLKETRKKASSPIGNPPIDPPEGGWLGPKEAEAEAKVAEALSKNEQGIEELLQLRGPSNDPGHGEGRNVLIIIDEFGVARRILPENRNALLPPGRG
jgi:hypothetical protein